MHPRRTWRPALVAVAVALAAGTAAAPAAAATPQPVYAPSGGIADPGVVRHNDTFVVFATGTRAPAHRGETASGPWTALDTTLGSVPDWAENGAVWAPDAVRTATGWVLYYSLPAKGKNGQRCIGAATSDTVDGPYAPVGAAPLICPGGAHGADDVVAGRPVAAAGVIDPSPFEDADGKRFVLYKTQQTPSSIRMLRLDDTGTRWVGNASGELVRNSGIIENPVLRQRGSTYVLFASRYGYDNCSYATVYLTSTDRWNFQGKTEHSLLTTAGTGICGPGGADLVPALVDDEQRLFLHGWVCAGTTPCRQRADGSLPADARRALYAAIFRWDGATPRVGALL
ncbi:glycoside hydrolase family 43 protein [Micromonospora sp. WMMD714]|uniref:glycoside hydrolase family 43 protein n=1 Tax=Micromonospora sp. WMMD714 TaxID=3016097 RepID=UPI00249A24E7|nr:glycoside hydrolase family 43 protein [Micromonospora sp. WMMD714]WFE66118.1 glycoside hydrolase family 43 protein [Micromonospora sp. WMMD714]